MPGQLWNISKQNCMINNRMGEKKSQSGFTFLEVMIAVAIIAIAFVTLIGSQSQSVLIAADSHVNVMATLLAQKKLAELESTEFDELYSETGSFEEGYSDFSWQTEVNLLSSDEVNVEGVDNMLKTIDLKIMRGENDRAVYSVRSVVMKKIIPEKK